MEVRDCKRLLRAGAGALGVLLVLALGAVQPDPAFAGPGTTETPGSVTDQSLTTLPGQKISGVRAARLDASDAPSIAQFSARRPPQVRGLLLAQARSEHSAAAAASALIPFLPAPATQLQSIAPQVAAATASADSAGAASLPSTLGREINALRDDPETEDEIDAQPRRRAAFQSAMQRAAANSALALRGTNSSSFQSSTSQQRFGPGSPGSMTDPFGDGMKQAAEAVSLIPGLSISSASLFAGYSSNAIPAGRLASLGALGGDLGADYDFGAQATFSYANRGRGSMFSVDYTPSRLQRVNLDQWSTTNHTLNVSASKELGAKWTTRLRANGGYNGLEQYWLEPAILHYPANPPATLDELYDAAAAGELTDEEFASVLTGAPVVDDPGGRQLDLGKVLTYGLSAGASYAYSPRWTFDFSGGISSSSLTNEPQARPGSLGAFYLRDSRREYGGASLSYRLSPRTSIAVSNATSVARSDYADTVSTNTMGTIQQRLTRSLRYHVGLGVGAVDWSRAVLVSNQSNLRYTWIANGGFDYTYGAHVFSFDTSRSAGDVIGLGARTTTQAQAQWQWASRRSTWLANAGIGIMRLSQGGGGQLLTRALNSDIYSAGFGRRLSASTLMRTDYYYGRYVSPYQGLFSNAEIQRLQVSLMWRPTERR